MLSTTPYLSQTMWGVFSTCLDMTKSLNAPGAKAGASSLVSAQFERLATISFQDLLNSSNTERFYPDDLGKQVMADYYAWKAQRPHRNLPDSYGDTEENRAFLQRNFYGELSLYERIYALDTMREMGMITAEEMEEAVGVGEHTLRCMRSEGNGAAYHGIGMPTRDPDMQKWVDFFFMSNIAWRTNLSALYDVVDDVRDFYNNAQPARPTGGQELAEDIQSTLNTLTSRKAS